MVVVYWFKLTSYSRCSSCAWVKTCLSSNHIIFYISMLLLTDVGGLGFRDGCFIESKHIATEWARERNNQYLNMY